MVNMRVFGSRCTARLPTAIFKDAEQIINILRQSWKSTKKAKRKKIVIAISYPISVYAEQWANCKTIKLHLSMVWSGPVWSSLGIHYKPEITNRFHRSDKKHHWAQERALNISRSRNFNAHSPTRTSSSRKMRSPSRAPSFRKRSERRRHAYTMQYLKSTFP